MIFNKEEEKNKLLVDTLQNNQIRSLRQGVGNQSTNNPSKKFFTNALRFSTQLGSDFLAGSSIAEALGYRPNLMTGQGYTPSYSDQFNTTVDLLKQGKKAEGAVKGIENFLT